MQPHDVPSPGFVSNGVKLRLEAYKAISTALIQAQLTNGESQCGGDLRAFFLACAEFCPTTPVKPTKKETR